MEADRRFRAMGTDVHVVVHGQPELLDLAQAEVERLEALWSRFRADSEVTRANEQAGAWVAVSPETAHLVDRALRGWRVTSGHFDPTVLGDVIRAGYDRTFDQLLDRPDAPVSHLRRGAGGVAVDLVEPAVRIPLGSGFDPGGMGKGLAADLVAARIAAEGAAGVLVNVGGDLRALGYGPGGEDWTVDIDPAATGLPLARVSLDRGALATSTVLRRRWRIDGRPKHHLIDPCTGEPADRGVVAASVLAAEGWQAEVLAKAALVGGLDVGLALLHQVGATGVLVDEVGTLHRAPGFDRFVVADRSPAPATQEG
ncbi:FAD:protein FMN transferase [Aquihabitans sp. G128]|uniref:FAD:protein FMN transferase n=1 Tax=Aquihabitans sp. G128 TaxID=2849779 RepID=UPI001C2399DA|nr:FAD:protein FMN transferase [Aquihabitans sp. G128]QXC61004.1 FAD:protein FMN transferase [Aquihabitans sp. G128]